jgi:dTDP-4-amino-4,6-dideoxygalactose transaminase
MPSSAMKPITVTQPFLPPLEDFVPHLERIWASKWLTNGGPYHQQFEAALARYLGVEHVALFANGTLGLVTALQALRISGEVITTPFSFVATAHSLLWNNIRPVFVDIDAATLTLDPARIEEAITPQTSAILPVHVYGRPCHVDAIERIAGRYGLKVIYDAAHAFGVRTAGRNLLQAGDLSVLSFHATKVFNTCEGGAIVCPDAGMKQRIDYLKNFGFADEVTVVAPGINAKMNEMQAALGLLQLEHVEASIARRRELDALYREGLRGARGIEALEPPAQVQSNHAYFPVLVRDDFPLSRDGLYEKLRERGVLTRRYFYPLISEFPMYKGLPSAAPARLPVATDVARRVLCLPLYPALADEQVAGVVQLIREA